mmetsp:Transcript_35180/g.110747  ORF Transcript_35180/g.110747 Transcript_35180/m.110747 type:complete len:205 (-) Transcript_35180:423-1037(-)
MKETGMTPSADEKEKLLEYFNTYHYRFIETHHVHEEKTFFPAMSERCEVPEKMSAEHKDLMDALHAVQASVGAMCAEEGGPAEVSDALDKMVSYSGIMKPHLLEEEQVGLPLLHQHFTPKEADALVAKVVKEQEWWELPMFLRPIKGLAAKQAYCKSILAIPTPVMFLVITPAIKRYSREIEPIINGLRAGVADSTPSVATTSV